MKFDWLGSSSHVFVNPKLLLSVDLDVLRQRQQGHLWLMTSGNTKFVGLSKEAILASAKAVNDFIASDSQDVWLQVLPEFHIGAIAIYARAFLSKAKVISHPFGLGQWDAMKFCQLLSEYQITLTSLVPTQVYDIVRQNLKAPPLLKTVFVGGSWLESWLYDEAKNLGWPLRPTYGMTECGSQIATASLSSPKLQILPHLKLKITEEGRVAITGPSLLTEYGSWDQNGKIKFWDPKIDGQFVAEDLGEIQNNTLSILGRGRDFIKVGAEGVYLNRLREIFHKIQWQTGLLGEVEIIGCHDERLGHCVGALVAEDFTQADRLVELFNAQVLPFERIRNLQKVKKIHRNELGKL